VVEVRDDLVDKVWTGAFVTQGDAIVILTLDDDFVTAAPLNSVHIIDTLQ
jgi:hypothetical protein